MAVLPLAGVVLLIGALLLLVVLVSRPIPVTSLPASIAPVTAPAAAPTTAPLTTSVLAGAFLFEPVLFLVELVVFLAEDLVLLLAVVFLPVPVFAAVEDFFEFVAEADFDEVDFLVVGAELLTGTDFLVVVDDFEEGLFVFEVAISFSLNVLNN